MAVAQWVRRWSSDHRVVQAKVQARVDIYMPNFYSAMIFMSVLLGLMNFSDIVILCNRPNSCCQQNHKCFDLSLSSSGLF